MMKTNQSLKSLGMWSTIVAIFLSANGCGTNTSEPPAAVESSAHEHDEASHGGWWCFEHGVPEEECSLCSAKAAENFKAKGDWCEKHGRAESQCFICDATRAEKFAKLYEAKYGERPPKPEE